SERHLASRASADGRGGRSRYSGGRGVKAPPAPRRKARSSSRRQKRACNEPPAGWLFARVRGPARSDVQMLTQVATLVPSKTLRPRSTTSRSATELSKQARTGA